MKAIFSENGVPAMVVGDQGPQFTSNKFQEFALRYHSFAEVMVKTVKKIMKKADASG